MHGEHKFAVLRSFQLACLLLKSQNLLLNTQNFGRPACLLGRRLDSSSLLTVAVMLLYVCRLPSNTSFTPRVKAATLFLRTLFAPPIPLSATFNFCAARTVRVHVDQSVLLNPAHPALAHLHLLHQPRQLRHPLHKILPVVGVQPPSRSSFRWPLWQVSWGQHLQGGG